MNNSTFFNRYNFVRNCFNTHPFLSRIQPFYIQVKLSPTYLPPAVASFFIHSSLDLFIRDPEVEQPCLLDLIHFFPMLSMNKVSLRNLSFANNS